MDTPTPPIRILYIDDFRLDRELVRHALEEEHGGFTVIESSTQQEFEARLAEGGYDLVLSDFNIAGFEGTQVLDLVQQRAPGTPVVIVTGTGSEEVAVTAMKRGAADYVIKTPQHIRKLPRVIEAALERQQLEAERLDAQAALVRSEEHFRALIEHALDIILVLTPDGTVRYASPSAERILGTPPEALIGHSFLEGVHEDDRGACHHAFNTTALHAGALITIDFRYRHHEEGWRTLEAISKRLEADGLPLANQASFPDDDVRLVVNARDVTARRQAEAEIRMLAHAIRSIGEALIITDLDDRILFVNNAFVRSYGYQSHEVMGRTATFLRAPDSTTEHFEKTIRNQTLEQNWSGEVTNCRKDGSTFPAFLSTSAIRDEQGQVVALLGVDLDITQRKRAEEEAQRYAARLQQLSRRLVEVQEHERRYIAMELHDQIGQQLTGLDMIISNLTCDSPEGQEKARGLVTNIIGDVRNLSLDLRPSMLDHLGLQPTLRWYVERYTERTQIEVQVTDQEIEEQRFRPEVETAAFRITQEALTNVARYAGVSSVSIHVWPDATHLHLKIQDQGRGFDPDALDPTRPSTGLSGMHERAALVGGHIQIQSHPGMGTRIIVMLPH